MTDLTINGIPLEHRLIHATDPAMPTLVFLHEGLGSVALWRDFPDKVAEATGAGALVYSRAGHGRSGPPAGPRGLDYLHREALEVLPAVLDRFGIVDPLLIGHSDGASIALLFAGLAGRALRGLVAEAPHVFVEDVTLAGIRDAVTAWKTTDLPQKLARHHDDAPALFSAWADTWLSPPFRDWNIEAMLPGITAPVLLVQGEDDEYGTPAQLEAIARQVSGPAETLLLPDCDHSPHRDRPYDVLSAVVTFIRTCAPH